MDLYSNFDYLCNEPYYLEGIGHVKCPTLRDIRNITYNIFLVYTNIVSTSFESYLKLHGLEEKYNELSKEEKARNTLYRILLFGNTHALLGALNFFIADKVEFNTDTEEFDIIAKHDEAETVIGHINDENFETFRSELQCILGLKKIEEKQDTFKNSYAKKMFEMLKKNNEEKKTKAEADENFSIDNMIKKYCAHNKVGINILNVWDMTYFQFITMFSEYNNGRHHDFNDLMAANTFSYKKASDYNSMDYMKKLN